MLTNEPAQGNSEVPPPSPANSTFSGTITAPGGPLKNWPFLLTRNGVAVDQAGLKGQSSNAFHDGCWWSGPAGEYKFAQMPAGAYGLEVLRAGGRVKAATKEPPPAESGLRGARPFFVDESVSRESPIDWLGGQ